METMSGCIFSGPFEASIRGLVAISVLLESMNIPSLMMTDNQIVRVHREYKATPPPGSESTLLLSGPTKNCEAPHLCTPEYIFLYLSLDDDRKSQTRMQRFRFVHARVS